MVAIPDGPHTYSRSQPKTENFSELPWPFALGLGCGLILPAIYLLAKAIQREDYFLLIGIFDGLIPFCGGTVGQYVIQGVKLDRPLPDPTPLTCNG